MNLDRMTILIAAHFMLALSAYATSAKGSHRMQNWQTRGNERPLHSASDLVALMLGTEAHELGNG